MAYQAKAIGGQSGHILSLNMVLVTLSLVSPFKLFGVYFALCPHIAPEKRVLLVAGTAS